MPHAAAKLLSRIVARKGVKLRVRITTNRNKSV